MRPSGGLSPHVVLRQWRSWAVAVVWEAGPERQERGPWGPQHAGQGDERSAEEGCEFVARF